MKYGKCKQCDEETVSIEGMHVCLKCLYLMRLDWADDRETRRLLVKTPSGGSARSSVLAMGGSHWVPSYVGDRDVLVVEDGAAGDYS